MSPDKSQARSLQTSARVDPLRSREQRIVALGRGYLPEVFADESDRMDPSVETLTLLTFWPCQCTEPDIATASVERRRDGERVVDVRACRECWGDIVVESA